MSAAAGGRGAGTPRRTTMSRLKLTARYARYALTALSTVAFGMALN